MEPQESPIEENEIISEEITSDIPQTIEPTLPTSPMTPTKPLIIGAVIAVILICAIATTAFALRRPKDPSVQSKIAQIQDATPSLEPTPVVTPTSSPVGSSSPRATSKATTTPRPTTTPVVSVLPNMRFHEVACTYAQPASASTPSRVMTLTSGQSFEDGFAVPSAISCNLIFENTSSVSTPEVFYSTELPGVNTKTTSIGVRGQGLYPPTAQPGENQQFISENFTLPRSVGSYTIRFNINPNKTFQESSFTDNEVALNYSITPDKTAPSIVIQSEAQSVSDSQVCYNFSFVVASDNKDSTASLTTSYQLDAGAWTSDKNTPVCVAKVSGASHTLRATSKDTSGNSAQAEKVFLIP